LPPSCPPSFSLQTTFKDTQILHCVFILFFSLLNLWKQSVTKSQIDKFLLLIEGGLQGTQKYHQNLSILFFFILNRFLMEVNRDINFL
jgi:hypothetical protein